MLCYNDVITNNHILEPGNNLQYINQWIDRVELNSTESSSNAAEDINKYLPEEKSLIFWMSDFHCPLYKIEKILNHLSNHHVIPIFISSEGEIKRLPRYGFRKFIDSELSIEHEIFLRPSIKEKILDDYKNTKDKIFQIFSKKELKEIVVNENINIESIRKYFLSTYI